MNLLKLNTELAAHVVNDLPDIDGSFEDIQHKLFGEQVYVIGNYSAKDKLDDWGLCPFDVMEYVREHEEIVHGICEVDLELPDELVNKFVEVIGKELLTDLYTDALPTNADLEDIHKQDIIDQLTANFTL